MAVLTCDLINEGFLQENVRPFCQAAKKRGRNIKRDDDIHRGGRKAGFHCTALNELTEGKGNHSLGEGGTWVNFCWVCAAGLSEPLPHYSLFCGQL